jgi:hypothetical protein
VDDGFSLHISVDLIFALSSFVRRHSLSVLSLLAGDATAQSGSRSVQCRCSLQNEYAMTSQRGG